MKTKYFWQQVIVIIVVYFILCYSLFPLITLYPDTVSPMIFALLSLGELLGIVYLFLYFILETENHSLKELWNEDKGSYFIVLLILIVVPILNLLIVGLIGSTQFPLDYPLLVFFPINILFVFVAYKLFRIWESIKIIPIISKETVDRNTKKSIIENKKELVSSLSDTTTSLPIVWIGDGNHPLYTTIKPGYPDLILFNSIASSYDNDRNLSRISATEIGLLVGVYPIPKHLHKLILFAVRIKSIDVIIVVKNKHFYKITDSLYNDPHCIIYKTDNKLSGTYYGVSKIIEQHRKHKMT